MWLILQQTGRPANPARFNSPFNETSGANLIKLLLHVHSHNSLNPIPDGIDPACTAVFCTCI